MFIFFGHLRKTAERKRSVATTHWQQIGVMAIIALLIGSFAYVVWVSRANGRLVSSIRSAKTLETLLREHALVQINAVHDKSLANNQVLIRELLVRAKVIESDTTWQDLQQPDHPANTLVSQLQNAPSSIWEMPTIELAIYLLQASGKSVSVPLDATEVRNATATIVACVLANQAGAADHWETALTTQLQAEDVGKSKSEHPLMQLSQRVYLGGWSAGFVLNPSSPRSLDRIVRILCDQMSVSDKSNFLNGAVPEKVAQFQTTTFFVKQLLASIDAAPEVSSARLWLAVPLGPEQFVELILLVFMLSVFVCRALDLKKFGDAFSQLPTHKKPIYSETMLAQLDGNLWPANFALASLSLVGFIGTVRGLMKSLADMPNLLASADNAADLASAFRIVTTSLMLSMTTTLLSLLFTILGMVIENSLMATARWTLDPNVDPIPSGSASQPSDVDRTADVQACAERPINQSEFHQPGEAA